MKTLTTMVMAAALAAAGATAGEGVLTGAERARARALPHYATAGFELEGGAVVYGAVVIAAFDDGTARVEFRGAGDAAQGAVSGTFDLAEAVASAGTLRAETSLARAAKGRYANHGTVRTPGGDAVAIDESSLRVDEDGLFALEVVGADAGRGPQRLRAFGRVIGTCLSVADDTVKRVADVTKRPDCQRLFGRF
jgi:hypothetical protein